MKDRRRGGCVWRRTPVQEWMSKIRLDHLVDQMTGLDLEWLTVAHAPE